MLICHQNEIKACVSLAIKYKCILTWDTRFLTRFLVIFYYSTIE